MTINSRWDFIPRELFGGQNSKACMLGLLEELLKIVYIICNKVLFCFFNFRSDSEEDVSVNFLSLVLV